MEKGREKEMIKMEMRTTELPQPVMSLRKKLSNKFKMIKKIVIREGHQCVCRSITGCNWLTWVQLVCPVTLSRTR